jgi:hypothetical protein
LARERRAAAGIADAGRGERGRQIVDKDLAGQVADVTRLATAFDSRRTIHA